MAYKKKDIVNFLQANDHCEDFGIDSVMDYEAAYEESLQIEKEARINRARFVILEETDYSRELQNLLKAMERSKKLFIEDLEYTPVVAAIQCWLDSLNNEKIKIKYAECMTNMLNKKIIHEFFADGKVFTVGGFRHTRHSDVIDYMRRLQDWSEETLEANIKCYTGFINYVSGISFGWFKKIDLLEPPRLGPKIMAQSLILDDWHRFINVLYKNNQRDSLIARVMICGARKMSEILDLRIDQIDFHKNVIKFLEKKKDKLIETAVEYPANFMTELREYVGSRFGKAIDRSHVFITRNGNPLTRARLNYSFELASMQAGIKKVTPEILRATGIMLEKQRGMKITEILKTPSR